MLGKSTGYFYNYINKEGYFYSHQKHLDPMAYH